MTKQELHQVRFPIGEFNKPEVITQAHIKEWVSSLLILLEPIISITESN